MGNYVSFYSEKEVVIKSWKLRVLKLLLQLAVLTYVVWNIAYQHGIQMRIPRSLCL